MSLRPAVLLTLALLAVPAAAVAKQAPGTYKGKTSQKLSISITVKKGAIVALHFKVKNDCGATHKPIDVEGGTTKIKSDGSFAMNLSNSSGSLKVSGVFDGTKASGTLREKSESFIADDTCDT